MSVLTVQTLTIAGLLASTLAAASTADKFTNDGGTFLLFQNTNASARTLTLTVQIPTVNKSGFNPVSIANPAISIPGSATNGGLALVGPFGPTEFNDANGQVNYTLDVATGMSVAAIKMPHL